MSAHAVPAPLAWLLRHLAPPRPPGWWYPRDDEPEVTPDPPGVLGFDPHGGPAITPGRPVAVAPPVDMRGWPSYRTDTAGGAPC